MIKVLLADDHTLVREGLRYILNSAGDIQIVVMASNGQEAVDQALQNCPDVAIMDISMPVIDGIEAARRICADCPDVRILMLSMHDRAEYIQRALQAGAHGYVLKDVAGNELVKAVRSLYKGKGYFSPRIAEIARRLQKS